MLNITPFRQEPGFCGPASLKMVLAYFGITLTEKKLARISGCTKSRGIGADALVQTAEALGFRARIKDCSDLEDIDEWVNRKKIPVIVDWFAFEGGHYSVVSGLDKENIYLQDPSLGHRRAMKRDLFKRLWFDFPNDYLKSRDELIIRRMIIIEPRSRYDRFRETGGYYAELNRLAAARRDIDITCHRIRYQASEHDFFRIASRDIRQEDKVVLIRAGIHGDEVAGPLAIIQYFDRIFDHAHKCGIKLIIYPLGNPSGYDAGQRYNTDSREGPQVNNDFVRYELEDGTIIDDIGRGTCFKRWYWSSDRRLNHDLPAETALMHTLLRQDPLESIVAFLDLHQDYMSPIDRAAAYHYAFGDLSAFRTIVNAVDKTVPVLADKMISAGQSSRMKTNKEGFIVRHDGTMGDLLQRLGVRYAVTAETTGKTPLEKACRVNWLWIRGLVDLSSGKKACVTRVYAQEVSNAVKQNAHGHRMIKAGQVNTDNGIQSLTAVVTKNYDKDLPRIFLSAGIHGEEPAGVYALIDFLNRGIAKYLSHYSFLILPCLNPYGFTRGVRFCRDVPDLNRSFEKAPGPPEVEAVKDILRRFPGPYRLAIDFHETHTHMPRGKDHSIENIPAGFYMYETTRTGGPALGPVVLRRLRDKGHALSRRRSVYGSQCRNGLIYSPPPDSPGFPDLPEFNGTLDWYLLKNGHTDHFLATETPTAWPLKRRIAAHRAAMTHALDCIRKR